jgi:predicted RNase H-like HicB family nuclease
MKNEFTAIIERDGDWYIAYCPEIPGADCQGGTKDEAPQNLAEGIELILKDRREDALHGVPPMRFERLSRSNEAEHGAISNDKEVLTRYGRTREPALSKRFLVTPKFLTALSKKFVVLFRSRKLRNIPV